MPRRLLFLLVAAAACAGCLTPGEKLDPAVTSQLAVGQTRAQVEDLVGPPADLETGGNGKSVAIYLYQSGTHEDHRDRRIRMLSVLYGRNFTVEEFLVHRSEIGYQPKLFGPDRMGEVIPRERIVQVMKPGIPREEIIAAFGSPTFEMLTLDGGRRLIWVAAKQNVWAWRNTFSGWVFSVECDWNGMMVDYKVSGNLDATPATSNAQPAAPAPKQSTGNGN